MVMSFATSPFRDHGFGCSRPSKMTVVGSSGTEEPEAEPERDRVMIASEGGSGQALSGGGAPAPSSASQFYTVQPGDNLYRIAVRFETTVARLSSLNNLSDPAKLSVGDVVLVPLQPDQQ